MDDTFILRGDSLGSAAVAFALPAGTFVLGRSSKCDFIVKDKSISRQHAEITAKEGKVCVRDLGSRNGTYINDQRVQQCDVHQGDHVMFGRVPFLLMSPHANLDEPASESETDRCDDLGKTLDVNPVDLLSPAQRHVFDCLLEGIQEKQIAERLFVSPHTVHNHVKDIYRILDVHSKSQLVARFANQDGDRRGRRSNK